MAFFGRLWRGEYSLARTFWLYGVVVNAVFNIFSRIATESSGEAGTGVILTLLFLPYYITWVGGVMRSANVHCATEGKSVFWGRTAQVVVIIGLVLTVFGLFSLMTYM